MFEDLQQMQ